MESVLYHLTTFSTSYKINWSHYTTCKPAKEFNKHVLTLPEQPAGTRQKHIYYSPVSSSILKNIFLSHQHENPPILGHRGCMKICSLGVTLVDDSHKIQMSYRHTTACSVGTLWSLQAFSHNVPGSFSLPNSSNKQNLHRLGDLAICTWTRACNPAVHISPTRVQRTGKTLGARTINSLPRVSG